MGFWKKVNEEIIYKGISRKELALLANIKESSLHKAIERDSEVSAFTAFSVSRVLDVPVEELLEIQRPNTQINLLNNDIINQLHLYKKYQKIIVFLESCTQDQKNTIKEFLQVFCNLF